MTTPANAGPTDRAKLTLIASSRAAALVSVLGTMAGMRLPQMGTCAATPTPMAKVKARRSTGGIWPVTVSTVEEGTDAEEVHLHGEEEPAPVEGVCKDARRGGRR